MSKRILTLLAAALTVLLCGCAAEQPAVSTEAPTEAETTKIYIDTPVDEPEWTLAEGALTLEDKRNLYAEGSDFLYFAIVGTTAEDMELRFKLDDVTAAMLREQSPENSYYITFNGEMIGSAKLNGDCSEAIVTQADAAAELTALASEIRGLG